MRDFSRLLRPASVVVVGGGAWCRAVIAQLGKAGFAGAVWHVHPTAEATDKVPVFRHLSDLPSPPDACFLGVNREATIAALDDLRRMGAGGAVCFASGFAEVADGAALHDALLAAAGDMPILGPNCYGFINALDGAMLWPDQHGCVAAERGVAILTQSSNIAINLTMQQRALPVSYVITCGNQAQTQQAEIARALLDDPRVTAIGLHVEGFGDLRHWEKLARQAAKAGIPLVALKVGRSDAAIAGTVSHTASLAGSDAGAAALFERWGIARVDTLPTFLETLKIFHVSGPLASAQIASISCSGGEASLAADLGEAIGVTFPPLDEAQKARLFDVLGPRVTLSNPLDYHTYIWRDAPAMAAAFSAIHDTRLALIMLIADFPRADLCDPSDWDCVIEAAIATRRATSCPVAVVATLPELLPEATARHLLAHGVIPIAGLATALAAIRAAAVTPVARDDDVLLPRRAVTETRVLDESDAKQTLASNGVDIPSGISCATSEALAAACATLPAPWVLKGLGFAHKSEHGAVMLGLTTPDAVADAAARMPASRFLLEEMAGPTVAELLVGVMHDQAHGFVMTLAAGGVMTELMGDQVYLSVPAPMDIIEAKLQSLRISAVLDGYRGKPAANRRAIAKAIMAIQSYVVAHAESVVEVEVNPLICTPERAIAADALIRIRDD